ncbi:MAG: hydrogenase formation protein HypD, partial [Minisyncoccia bacterium]
MEDVTKKINTLAEKIGRNVILMELCGTHTEAVAKFGIKKLLPKNIKLLSGPGCPVCVTDQSDINAVIKLALEGIPISCYGDVLRVPGTMQMKNKNDKSKFKNEGKILVNKGEPEASLSLDKARELGADVTEVYSTEDALKLQKTKPDLVFFGLGFETTTPMTADAIKRGLTVYSSHKLFVPAMQALADTPSLKIDGFINPGHVSTIIGTEPYKELRIMNYESRIKFKIQSLPQVITGFTSEDVLIGIYMLLKQIAEGRAEVENEYTRAVRQEGNPIAMKLINEVFEVEDAFWRGLGKIPNSGFEIRPKYSKYDAKVKYKDILSENYESRIMNHGCICGAILRGLK